MRGREGAWGVCGAVRGCIGVCGGCLRVWGALWGAWGVPEGAWGLVSDVRESVAIESKDWSVEIAAPSYCSRSRWSVFNKVAADWFMGVCMPKKEYNGLHSGVGVKTCLKNRPVGRFEC